MSYSKLYSSIVQSSLWNEQDHVRLLFITLLALADREGFVLGSRMGLMRIANLDPDTCEEFDPFQILMNPDPDSSDLMRNPENEGRRIEAASGGYRILNFLYYRSLRNEDDRREQNKEAQQRFRNKHKPKSASVSQGQPGSANGSQRNPISEEEADALKEKEQREKPPEPPKKKGRRSAPVCDPSDEFLEFWEEYPRKQGMKKAWASWEKSHPKLESVLETLSKYKKTEWRHIEKRFIPLPATWLNQERWDDEL